jgi:hypothetical protein
MSRMPEDLPADLAVIGDRLRDERPALDPLALDAVAQRAGRAAVTRRRRSRRPSLAVALCLCFGIVLSSAGTGMAISGLSSTTGTAAQAQYPGSEGVSGAGTIETPSLGGTSTPATKQAKIAVVKAASGGSGPSQATQQLSAAAGNATLPFTGYAAIPVAGAGLALLLGGLVLRRRASPGDPA